MKVIKVTASDEALLEGSASAWSKVKPRKIELMPSPVGMAEEVSPFMALSEDHGKVEAASLQLALTETSFSARMTWADKDEDAEPQDLDQFADGAALMFALAGEPDALTMGAEGAPVNAWLWKADEEAPIDVVAEGYATSERRAAGVSGLKAQANHDGARWTLIFQRPRAAADAGFVSLEEGRPLKLALAIWEGANKERAGQKAISGEFMTLDVLGAKGKG